VRPLGQPPDRLRREDHHLAASRTAEVPDDAVDEDVVAGVDDARPEHGAGLDAPVAVHPQGAAGHDGVGRNVVAAARDLEGDVAGLALVLVERLDRSAGRHAHLVVPVAGDQPLQRLEGELVEARGGLALLGVDAVEGRLHRARRDLEGLEEVAAEGHRHAQGHDEHLEVLGPAAAVQWSPLGEGLVEGGGGTGRLFARAAAQPSPRLIQRRAQPRGGVGRHDVAPHVVETTRVRAQLLELLAGLAQGQVVADSHGAFPRRRHVAGTSPRRRFPSARR